MSYLPMGDVASSDYNSTKYPGVCKPSTVAVLATFKRLQTQLNRVAAAKGVNTVAIDGDIGPGTVSLAVKFQKDLIAYAMGNQDIAAATKIAFVTSSCTTVAQYADVIANVADSYADSLKAPANPPAPKPTKPPTLVDATGIEKPAPAAAGILTAFESAPTTHKIALLGVLGAIGFVLMKKPRRRR